MMGNSVEKKRGYVPSIPVGTNPITLPLRQMGLWHMGSIAVKTLRVGLALWAAIREYFMCFVVIL
jgi:hypothetical protein